MIVLRPGPPFGGIERLHPCKNHVEILAGVFGLFFATSRRSYKKYTLGLWGAALVA